MNTPTYNAQFLTIDFRMLDSPAFGEFMKTTAFAVYLQLRRYIWRSRTRRHPISQVNDLFAQGYLVATAERSFLARKLGIKEERHISRHITDLCRMGVIERISTGRQNIYVLGQWEDRSVHQDGSYVIEIFLLERHFGIEKHPQIIPDVGTGAGLSKPSQGGLNSEVSMSDTPEMSASDTSDVSSARTSQVSSKRSSEVSRTPPYKYRAVQIEKQQQTAALLLKKFRLSKKQIEEICDTYPEDRIREVVRAYGQRSEGKIENPAGWVLAALREDYEFDSAEKRRRAKQARRREQETIEASREANSATVREQLSARVQAWIEAHPEEYAQILEAERQRWAGSPAGESTAYLQTCARVRVQERLSKVTARPAGPFTRRSLRTLGRPPEGDSMSRELSGPREGTPLLAC